MALKVKKIKGSGLVQLRSVRTSQEGNTFIEVQTFTGPYADLVKKQDANLGAKGTHLEPTEAGHGKLTLTFESQTTDYHFDGRRETFTEVLWQELRQPVHLNAYFDTLTTDQVEKIYLADSGDEAAIAEVAGMDTIARELLGYLRRGIREFSTGVPVVRRTKTRVRGDLSGGGAWFRDNPPVSVDGEWEWMKTVDERRRDGKGFTQVEEWTGATKWDEKLYPVTPAP